jgi:hypothetical protein
MTENGNDTWTTFHVPVPSTLHNLVLSTAPYAREACQCSPPTPSVQRNRTFRYGISIRYIPVPDDDSFRLPTVLLLNFRDVVSEAHFTARLFNVYNRNVEFRDKTKGLKAWMNPDVVVVDGRQEFGNILRNIRDDVFDVSYFLNLVMER